MRVLGVIPARGGSKGVSRKNLRPLGGRPLIAWTIDAARGSALTRTILSTDDDEIARVGRDHGVEVPFLRPAELATDSAKAIPVLQHALQECEVGERYDAVMMLQPTTPFRTSAEIDAAIARLAADPTLDSVITVIDVGGHHPARMKYLEDGILVDPPFCEAVENQPRQELVPMYLRSGAIYLTRRDVLVGGSLKGRRCGGLVIAEDRSVNIDTERDLAYAELLLSRAP